MYKNVCNAFAGIKKQPVALVKSCTYYDYYYYYSKYRYSNINF